MDFGNSNHGTTATNDFLFFEGRTSGGMPVGGIGTCFFLYQLPGI